MNRREFLRQASFGAAFLAVGASRPFAAPAPARPLNLLLITADDMLWRTPGVFGGTAPQITPNLDRLAAEGLHFDHAHVTIAVCQPSRSVMMTGRYPHRNGAEGFEPIKADVPTLTEQLHKAGYLNGILGKVIHLAPREKFFWDMTQDQKELGVGRDPDLYYRYTREFFARAAVEGKPFFLMANSHDPHRPFWTNDPSIDRPGAYDPPPKAPSRIYKPAEVTVPGFLPDIPDVRLEQSEYNNSARRCDDTVGAILRALKESGAADNTLVIFLSDNGMSVPFAKSNCYLNSTRTPMIVRWPGKVKPGTVDRDHFVSGIDLTPTFLDAAGLAPLAGVDGRSFAPLLRGGAQDGRDHAVTVYHRTSADAPYPMRCVQDAKFGYIVNLWSDGKRVYRSEAGSGRTLQAMVAAAEKDAEVAERVKFYQLRAPEEFYDLQADPDALHNLIKEPQVQAEIERFRKILLDWMEEKKDPALDAFKNRNTPEALASFMAAQDEKRQAARQAKGKGPGQGKAKGKKKGRKTQAAAESGE